MVRKLLGLSIVVSLFFGLILFFSGCGSSGGPGDAVADPIMLFSSNNSIRLQWNEVTTTIDGQEAYISFYKVYYRQHGTTQWQWYDDAPGIQDPWIEIYNSDLGNGYWDFAVTAVDYNSQESSIHMSLDNSAIPTGGWYLLWDISGKTPPATPSGLKLVTS